MSTFAELNVRTYVKNRDRAGVWFFSLDAASRFAVEAARAWLRLPYLNASIRLEQDEAGWFDYECQRRDRRGQSAQFCGRYRPIDVPCCAQPGTLDHWLTERYCFFAADGHGRLSRTDVHHRPWPLQKAEAVVDINGMVAAAGLALPSTPSSTIPPPVLHFADKLDVLGWRPVVV